MLGRAFPFLFFFWGWAIFGFTTLIDSILTPIGPSFKQLVWKHNPLDAPLKTGVEWLAMNFLRGEGSSSI